LIKYLIFTVPNKNISPLRFAIQCFCEENQVNSYWYTKAQSRRGHFCADAHQLVVRLLY